MDLESLSDFARFSPLGFSLLSAALHTFLLPVETLPFSQVFRKSCRKLYKRQSVVGVRDGGIRAGSLVGGVYIAACKYAFDYTPKTCSQTKAMPKLATMAQ